MNAHGWKQYANCRLPDGEITTAVIAMIIKEAKAEALQEALSEVENTGMPEEFSEEWKRDYTRCDYAEDKLRELLKKYK
jgi:hypothetical protein